MPQKEAEQILSMLFEDLFQVTNPGLSREILQTDLPLFESALKRLENNEPVQYITGKVHFYGYIFSVNNHVLIPRPETEELVFVSLQILKGINRGRPINILDVGTGSGVIPVSLKLKMPNLLVTAIDIVGEALKVAEKNAKKHDVEINFMQFDFAQEKKWPELGVYDIIISNPPYIGADEKDLMADRVLDYEPMVALFAPKDDPVYFYRKLFRFSKDHLSNGGYMVLELNEFHSSSIKKEAEKHKFQEIRIEKDMQGKERILICKK